MGNWFKAQALDKYIDILRGIKIEYEEKLGFLSGSPFYGTAFCWV
ncbi:hypothetical protein J2Z23_001395 [Lederbergia galactosidilyticus]|nr:hypothetical protein [Lederbergia galactosidilytica]